MKAGVLSLLFTLVPHTMSHIQQSFGNKKNVDLITSIIQDDNYCNTLTLQWKNEAQKQEATYPRSYKK